MEEEEEEVEAQVSEQQHSPSKPLQLHPRPEDLVAKAIAPVKRDFLCPPPSSRPNTCSEGTHGGASMAKNSNGGSSSNVVKEKKSRRQLKRERQQVLCSCALLFDYGWVSGALMLWTAVMTYKFRVHVQALTLVGLLLIEIASHYWKEKKSAAHICPEVAKAGNASACRYGSNCHFSHDIEAFKAQKPADLEGTCPFFGLQGSCPYGLACRFSGSHEVDAHVEALSSKQKHSELNGLKKDIQKLLWKNKLKFPKTDARLKLLGLLDKSKTKKPEVKKEENDQANLNGHCAASEIKEEGGDPASPNGHNSNSVSNGDEVVCEPVNEIKHCTEVLVEEGLGDDALESNDLQPLKKTKVSQDENHLSKKRVDEPSPFEENFEENDKRSVRDTTATDVLSSEADGASLKLHPREKKLIDFRGKLYLAPLTTVGNLPFRRVCKELGADITCGEMAMCTNLLQIYVSSGCKTLYGLNFSVLLLIDAAYLRQVNITLDARYASICVHAFSMCIQGSDNRVSIGQASEWALLRRHSSEDLFGVQICGAYPDTVARTVELISQECEVDFIDINMGCPIDIVVNKGAGSSLLTKPMRMKNIIEAASAIVEKPLTVKVRTGFLEGRNRIDSMIADISKWGASALTIHGRSRQQRYSKLADWDYIYQCARKAPDTFQVLGNGDVCSYLHWNKHLSDCPQLSACMIARGALIKPWIFTEIKEQRHWDITASERLDILKDFTRCGLEHWGSDSKGVETTRHFLLEWLSYTCRYVPVGLLDVIPQQLNWRPPSYFGRNDLETLMASDSAADWIRISEMLLGKVPAGFSFAPKHKSNAYDRAENG
ncbi:hypothetical protein Scep_000434 [Stephania cephalantha]|uniref:tRNA-dihydrouridine(47) synthase [NAD(P)(+)] n=1 Tax=Stephania cephalantha TaxID=152367 RepID=A0AAP0L7L9_9MAGN